MQVDLALEWSSFAQKWDLCGLHLWSDLTPSLPLSLSLASARTTSPYTLPPSLSLHLLSTEARLLVVNNRLSLHHFTLQLYQKSFHSQPVFLWEKCISYLHPKKSHCQYPLLLRFFNLILHFQLKLNFTTYTWTVFCSSEWVCQFMCCAPVSSAVVSISYR